MIPIIEKIKSRGYWRILFQPLTYKEQIGELRDCKKIVERNAVLVRGWDFPHIPRREGDDTDLLPGNNYYEGWVDWSHHKELWRFFQSCQFISFRGFWEDWSDEEIIRPEPRSDIKRLGVLTTIYQVAEIYEFLSGLAREGIYREGVKVSITLFDTEHRELWLEDRSRAPFMDTRRTGALNVDYNKEYSETKLKENSIELSTDAILYIFHRFEWEPSKDHIRKEQEELFKRRRRIAMISD